MRNDVRLYIKKIRSWRVKFNHWERIDKEKKRIFEKKNEKKKY